MFVFSALTLLYVASFYFFFPPVFSSCMISYSCSCKSVEHQPGSIVNCLPAASELPKPFSMLITPLSWEHYKISTKRSIDAWIINPPSLPKNRAIFILHVFRWLKVNQLHAQSPRLYSELQLNVQGLTDRWRFVISLSLSLSPCSRAVIPMDSQWISHFHPAG